MAGEHVGHRLRNLLLCLAGPEEAVAYNSSLLLSHDGPTSLAEQFGCNPFFRAHVVPTRELDCQSVRCLRDLQDNVESKLKPVVTADGLWQTRVVLGDEALECGGKPIAQRDQGSFAFRREAANEYWEAQNRGK